MSLRRGRCPVCRTGTAVAVGEAYECHACGRSFAAGIVRVPRAWGAGGEAMADGAFLDLPYPETGTVAEETLEEQSAALAAALRDAVEPEEDDALEIGVLAFAARRDYLRDLVLAVAGSGRPGEPVLVRALAHESATVRETAAEILAGRLECEGDSGVLDGVLALLEHPLSEVRSAAAVTLACASPVTLHACPRIVSALRRVLPRLDAGARDVVVFELLELEDAEDE